MFELKFSVGIGIVTALIIGVVNYALGGTVAMSIGLGVIMGIVMIGVFLLMFFVGNIFSDGLEDIRDWVDRR